MGDFFDDEPPVTGLEATASSSGPPPNKDLTGHKLVFLVPFPIPGEWIASAKQRYPGLEIVDRKFNPWERGELPGDVDWGSVTVLVTGPVLPQPDQAPRLRLVQLMTAGANYALDKPLFKDTDVAFATANGVHGPQIAEWVVMTYLAYQHRLPLYLDNQKKGRWDRDTHDLDTVDVVRQRIGILGYGSIGRHVARVATAMGAEVYAYTAHPRPTPESRRDKAYHVPGLGDPEGKLPTRWFSGTTEGEVREFLTSGLDLLVVAVPLTDATRGLLGEAQFRALYEAAPAPSGGGGGGGEEKKKKPRTYVTNIGRGPVVDTDALIQALDEGWIRGAALDVTDPEPLPENHPLWHKDNVIITPHVSGNSDHYTDRLLGIIDVNLERLSKGEEFINQVNKKQGY